MALVEKARPGGDCTHYGCVPSKTLLDVAHRVAGARQAQQWGLESVGDVDFGKFMAHVHDVISQIEQDESPAQLAAEGIALIDGWARFTSARTIDIDGRALSADRFVLATGAHAAIPPIPGLHEVPYLDNKTLFDLTDRPHPLLLMGGGAIGVELAQAFSQLGSRVTVVEAAPRIFTRATWRPTRGDSSCPRERCAVKVSAVSTSPPSGRQHVLVRSPQRAVVVEVGGGLRSYSVEGREVLDGYAEHQRASAARGQPLIPWPNRLRDGRYVWDGQQHQVALSEPERSNAIHGLVRWVSWTATAQTTSSVEMRCRLHPQSGYPFMLDIAITYALTDSGLDVSTTACNAGSEALPYAAGQHPYLLSPTTVDDCTLTLDAATYLETDDRGLPVTRELVAGSPYDFRAPRTVGGIELDHAFTDLNPKSSGRAWVRLTSPGGVTTAVWVDDTYPYIELFTGDALPDPERRRRSLGVEPMTAPPNAFGDSVGVTRLEPGASTTSRWGITVTRGGDVEEGRGPQLALPTGPWWA